VVHSQGRRDRAEPLAKPTRDTHAQEDHIVRRIFSAALVAIVTLGLIAPAVAAHAARPLWGWSSGVTTFYDNPKDCEAGVTTTTDLPAFTSHLGRSHLIMTHCPVGFSIEDGDLTLVAADGDELVGTYVGDVTAEEDFSVFYATLTITFTGGTGRFDDAQGTAVMYAVVINGGESPEWDWSATWWGMLAY
jgi:hypothetical protein